MQVDAVDSSKRLRNSGARPLTITLLLASALLLSATSSAAPAAKAKANKLVSIINPQGNFLKEGLGKILHAGPSFGGQLVWNWEFAQALAKSKAAGNIDVDIVTQQVTKGDWPKEMGEPVTVVQKRGKNQGQIRIVRVPLGRDGAYLDKEESYPELAAFASRLERFYQSEGRRPKLLYAAYADGAAVAENLRKATGVNYIFHPHSLGRPKLKGMIERALENGMPAQKIAKEVKPYRFPSRDKHETGALRNAIAIIANSHTEVRDQHREHYGKAAARAEKEGRFHAIPPGLKTIFLQDGNAATDAKATKTFVKDMLGGKTRIDASRKDLPVLFTYARPVPIKNISEFVRAMAMDAKLLKTHNIVVLAKPPQAGDAQEIHDEWAKLHSIIESPTDPSGKKLDVALKGKIAIIGPRPQDDIAAILRHLGKRPGSVHVNPALYEAFGLTVIEAMAAGLPVAATANGGPGEHPVVSLFPPQDHKKMAESIRRQASTKGWAKRASKGQSYARGFDWNKTVTTHLSVKAVADALEGRLPAEVKELEAIDAAKARKRYVKREKRGNRAIKMSLIRAAGPKRAR